MHWHDLASWGGIPLDDNAMTAAHLAEIWFQGEGDK
jgi:hypothetical protein